MVPTKKFGDHDSSPFVPCGSLAPSPASLLVRAFDAIGHHRAACARVGMLGRGFVLESVAARLCGSRRAGVRTPLPVGDARRLEIVVDGLPVRGSAIEFGQFRLRPAFFSSSANSISAISTSANFWMLNFGTTKCGGPKGGGPKFRAFFSLLRHNFFFFFLSWGSFRGILVVFEAAGALECARLEFSGCRVKPRRPGRGFVIGRFAVAVEGLTSVTTVSLHFIHSAGKKSESLTCPLSFSPFHLLFS